MTLTSWTSAVGRHPILTALAVTILAVLGWAALAPIEVESRDRLFEIPRGTFARHMAGDKHDTLPRTIQLTLGIKDVLVFKNSDEVPHIFGPTLIMPGQSFRLPFSQASTNNFQCTAHSDGGLSVIVDPNPAPGWGRLRWRWRELASAS